MGVPDAPDSARPVESVSAPRPIGVTPEVPEWVRSFRLAGYRNVYELLPREPNLYGHEDLYGDWNATTLVLGRSWGTVADVTRRVERRERPAYGHHRGEKKTEALKQRLMGAGLARGIWNRECGLLYGDAAAGLLRRNAANTGRLPNEDEALVYGVEVLAAVTLPNLPRLRRVICLGREAWAVAAAAFGRADLTDVAPADRKPTSVAPPPAAATDLHRVRLLPLPALTAGTPRAGSDAARRWEWASYAAADRAEKPAVLKPAA